MKPRTQLFVGAAALAVIALALFLCCDPQKPPMAGTAPRIAARAKGDVCPQPAEGRNGSWTVQSVFEEMNGRPLPAFLKGRCVYEWTGSGAPDPDALPIAELDELSADPPIVVPLALDPVMVRILGERRDELAKQAGLHALGGTSPPPAFTAGATTPVLIGFPDSSPSNMTSPGTIPQGSNAHGFNVAWITRHLTCLPGGGTCLSSPLTELGFDAPSGAGAGTAPRHAARARTSFAKAVQRIVDRWKSGPPGRRLVLNIAAGWEPAYECVPFPTRRGRTPRLAAPPRSDNDVPTYQGASSKGADGRAELAYPPSDCDPQVPISQASQDVFDALRYAACEGALIVAASGNDPGYATPPEGLMMPASWTVLPRPNAAVCAALGVGSADASDGLLVHAVSGVDGGDLPIVLSRKGSRTALTAPASLLVGYPNDGSAGYPCPSGESPPCAPSYVMTGTSVSAAVVSSIAAAVWAKNGGLTPEEVMRVVHRTGVPLGLSAAVCMGSPCPDVRRASMCRAVTCAGDTSGSCTADAVCAPRPAYRGAPTPGTMPDGPPVRTTTPFRPTGVITGQPLVGCPPCWLSVLAPDAAYVNPADGTLSGSIDPRFFGDAGETVLQSPSIRLLDAGLRPLADHSWTAASFPQSGPHGVSLSYTGLSVPTYAVLTFNGGTGQIYSQEIPIRYVGP